MKYSYSPETPQLFIEYQIAAKLSNILSRMRIRTSSHPYNNHFIANCLENASVKKNLKIG